MSKPIDKVQIYKRESVVGGGDTTDNDEFYQEAPLNPAEDAPEVQGIFFQDINGGQINDEEVYISRAGDNLLLKDKATGQEILLNDLPTKRHLIQFLDEGPAQGFITGAYKETIGGMFPTQVIWWESSAKLKKIVETIITRNNLITPTPIIWKIYAADGITVLNTITDNINYSGIIEVSRTRIIS